MLGPDKVNGETLLTAIIAGFEVGPRVGLCMNGNRMLAKGWHTPGIFGPFPAAVAAGRVLGLSSDQLYQALGIAGPQAAGLMARSSDQWSSGCSRPRRAERPVLSAAGGRRLYGDRRRVRGGVWRLLHDVHPEHGPVRPGGAVRRTRHALGDNEDLHQASRLRGHQPLGTGCDRGIDGRRTGGRRCGANHRPDDRRRSSSTPSGRPTCPQA